MHCCRALSRAHDIYKQLHGQMQRAGLAVGSSTPDRNAVLRALLSGLFPHAAQRTLEGVVAGWCSQSCISSLTGAYKVVATGQTVHIHPSSVLCGKAPACIVFSEAVHTSKHYARQVSAVDASWLVEAAPQYFAKANT